MKNKCMNVDNNVKLYETLVRSIMTSETRAETSRAKQLLRTVKRVRNSDMREQCSVTDIAKFIGERRCWNEHVVRADDTRLIKLARDCRPPKKRSVGRLQKVEFKAGCFRTKTKREIARSVKTNRVLS